MVLEGACVWCGTGRERTTGGALRLAVILALEAFVRGLDFHRIRLVCTVFEIALALSATAALVSRLTARLETSPLALDCTRATWD